MKLLRKSITNSVVYSGISLIYSFLLILSGKYRDIHLQNITLFNVGVIMLIMSVILGIFITSTVQSYDEYQMKLFMGKMIINGIISTVFILITLILSVCFLLNSNLLLLCLMVSHWVILTVAELIFVLRIK